MTTPAPNLPPPIQGSLLARNSVLNFIGQVIPLLVGVLAIPFIIRGLGVERFGILALAWVVVGYFGLFDLGLGRATTKFVAELLGKGELPRLPSLVWTSVVLHTLFGAIGGLVLAAATPLLVERLLNVPGPMQAETRTVFLLMAGSLPLLFVLGVFRGALAAAQRFDLLNAVQVPSSVLWYALQAVAVLLGFGLTGLVGLLIVLKLATALAFFLLCRHVFPSLKAVSFDHALLRPLLSYGGWVTVTSVVGPILIYLDRMLVASLLSVAAVAYYAAPYQVVSKLTIFPASLTATLFPAFSALAGPAAQSRREELLTRSFKLLFLLVGPVVIVLVFFAPDLLRLWLGTDFADQSTVVFQILAVGVLVNSLAWLPFSLLQGIGRPDLPAKFHLLELPIYVVLAMLLVTRFGIAGAALAWACRVTLDAVLLGVAARKLNQMSFRALARNGLLRCAVASGGLATALAALPLVSRALPTQIAFAAALMCVFAVAVWQYVLDAAERDTLRLGLSVLSRWGLAGARSAR